MTQPVQSTPRTSMSEVELFLRCLDFVREQSAGEWGDDVEREDARKLMAFVRDLIGGRT